MRDLTTAQLEARLRDALHGEADSLPFSVDASHLAARLAQRRRMRRLERGVLAAAAAVVVVVGAAAAFLLNNHNAVVPVGATPTPSATAAATSAPPASGSPSPAASASVGNARIPAGCVHVDPSSEANLPTFNLGPETGDDIGVPGTLDAYSIGADSSAGSDWLEPGVEEATYVSGSDRLKLILSDGVCLRTYQVDYAPAGAQDYPPQTTELAMSNSSMGILDRLTFGPMPAGDWVLRVRVEFWADISAKVTEDRFYRVFVDRSGPSPSPTPIPQPHSPTSPCGTPDLTANTPPAVTLTIPTSAPVTGEFGTTAWHGSASDAAGDVIPTTVTAARDGLGFSLDIAGDVCADAWSISLAPIPTGQDGPPVLEPSGPLVPEQANPEQALAFAAENHFALSIVQSGEWVIRASLQFPDGDAQVYWRIKVDKLVIPAATLSVGAGGSQVGLAACGASWAFAAGGSGGESCGSLGDAPAGALSAPAGSTLTITTPAWTMSSADARWVKASAYDGTQLPRTQTTVTFTDGTATITPPSAGDWVLLAGFSLHHGPDTWNISYLFHVRVGG